MQLVWKPMALEDRERIFDWLLSKKVHMSMLK